MRAMNTRIFVVVQTKDGKPRGFEKVSGERFFMIEEEAHAYLAGQPDYIKAAYKVAPVLAYFEPSAPEPPPPWRREGVYTKVEMRETTTGVAYGFHFWPDGVPEKDAEGAVVTWVSVRQDADLGIYKLASVLHSVGVPEPERGWKAAFVPRAVRTSSGAVGVFMPLGVLAFLRDAVEGKRGGIARAWLLRPNGSAYDPLDAYFPLGAE